VIEHWGNVIEAVFWIVVAAIVYCRSHHKAGTRLGTGEWAAITFFWFGISDFIEVRTGAWYRPLGLLAMKAACIAALLFLYVRHRRLPADGADSANAPGAGGAAKDTSLPPAAPSDPSRESMP
jgi:hypothetical protein